jgi:OPA family glycerol-3-phosphate transporter-like MFS transporter/OPA family sugar phosphate sensor protein UhpC-like MFS transporter
MAHWFRPSELATKQSIWNASHSIGAGVVIALCGWMLGRFGYSAWNLCFIVPAAISLLGAAALYASLRDDPSSVGLPPVEEFEAEGNGSEKASEASAEVQLTGEKYRAFISRMVFRNPVIWVISVSNFCVYVIRFTILEWGTSFLTQYKGMEIAGLIR